MSESTPIIAIVGRPNVGKSTLFNRYAGRRRVLVDDTPGVTRDRIVEEIEVEGRRVLVVDTAGLDPDPESAIESAVQAQARTALEQADAIVFVVDGQSGVLPLDKEIARELRRTAKPVVVAVNKVDHPKHQSRTAEFHELGLPQVCAVSAEHGSGAFDVLEQLVAALPPGKEGSAALPSDLPRVALVGRPNVGKSSLLNRLVGEERVVVADAPGTTRDAIDIEVTRGEHSLVFVDTAGIRRPSRRQRTNEHGSALMAIRAIERARVALVLMDAGEGMTDQDLRVLALVRERGCACALLVNKWDLAEAMDAGERRRLDDEIARRLRPMADVPILRLSARTGRGTGRIFELVDRLAVSGNREIPTGELNRWLEDAVSRHEPAMAQRGPRKRPIKFFYATQTGVRPPSFVLFCTEPEAVMVSYRRFLENRLREQFDLIGTPIRLVLRKRGEAAGTAARRGRHRRGG